MTPSIHKPSPRADFPLGKSVAQIREQRGMSIEALAAKASLSMEYLLGLEGGIREFSPWAVTRLARALDIDAPPVGAGFEEIEESTADVRQRIIDCAAGKL